MSSSTIVVRRETVNVIVRREKDVITRIGKGIQGLPGTAAASFLFIQSSPALIWIINHNLGVRPSVELRTMGGAVIDADIVHISVNQVQVYFLTPFAGEARCF